MSGLTFYIKVTKGEEIKLWGKDTLKYSQLPKASDRKPNGTLTPKVYSAVWGKRAICGSKVVSAKCLRKI